MQINNWSIIKENSNNIYCDITDPVNKYIKGNFKLNSNSNLTSNIETAEIKDGNNKNMMCYNNQTYKLGYINNDYQNYLNARNNNLGIVSNWYLYYDKNTLKIKAILNKNNKITRIDDEVISHNSKNNQLILKNNEECFLIVDSINEYAKQFLILNKKMIQIENHTINNITDFALNNNFLKTADDYITIELQKTLKK